MSFADYPEPEEGPDTGYAPTVGSNPVLRGIPLLLGGNLYVNSLSLPSHLPIYLIIGMQHK